MEKTVIVDYCRSGISRAKDGALNQLSGLEIATQVVQQLLKRNSRVPQDRIECLAAGCAFPEGENGMNVARSIVIKAGMPQSVAAVTLNHYCGSSQTTVAMISDMIAAGKADVGIAVGLEHMKRVPMGGFNPAYDKQLHEQGYYLSMGLTAEILAKDLTISREEQETFSINSHKKALKAWSENAFAKEVVAVQLADGSSYAIDENPKEPDVEKIKSLKPAFDTAGTITAATASPVTTGAAAILLMSESFAKQLDIVPRAHIVTTAMAGCEPQRMGLGPLPATDKALKRAGLAVKDIDIFELNEAFAAQSLYVIKKGGWDINKVNVLGGAIALGHPLGMSGARIIGTAITALEKTGGTYGLATMCIGGGQGVTTILKRG